MSRAAAFALLLLSGCLVDGLPCRSQGECMAGHACVGPDVHNPGCGVAPRHECSNDSGCSSGQVCHAIADSCSLGGIGTQCGSPCTADADCGGFRCSAFGACEPPPCSEGAVCSAIQHCVTVAAQSGTPALSNGCAYTFCSGDFQCASGQACVNGICQRGPGTCHVIELRP